MSVARTIKRRRQHGASRAAISPAPVLTGTTSGGITTGNSITLTVPATTQVGDTILVAVSWAFTTVPNGPAGYTAVRNSASITNWDNSIIAVYSKVATLADIGNSVTISNLIHPPAIATIRTYTCGGVDTSASAVTTSASLAPPSLTSSTANELQVTFFAGSSQSAPSISFTAGSSHTLITAAQGDQQQGSEDWALPVSDTQVSGGVASIGSTPALAAVSVMLKPTS